MPSFVIGTAGHVNHGKTALVHALTGVATDRVPEEKRRGITIELGFAPLALPELGSDARGSVVDVPGHRRFVSTMIAGASGIEVVLLVVAADEGVMPQTREHLEVCELLGLRRGVVALTKIDRVDDETRALAMDEVQTLLRGRLEAAIVPCVPPSGAGVDAVRAAIAAALGGRERPSAAGGPRLWIDRVLRVHGAGTVVTGTLTRGRVARGDHLVVATPAGLRPCVVRGLQMHGAPAAEASAPTRLALNLSLDAEAVARGDLVTAEHDAPGPTSCLDVGVRGVRLRRGAHVVFHTGTAARAARVTRVDPLGDATLARILLERPLPASPGERFLARGSNATAASPTDLAGGVILDARPLPRIKAAARRTLGGALLAGDAPRALDTLLDAVGPRPVLPDSLALSVSLEDAARAATGRGGVVACGRGFVRRDAVAALAERARAHVTAYVTQAPLDRGMPLAALRAELARTAGEDVADAAIRAARARTGDDDGGAIAIDGDVVVPAARCARLPREVAERLDRARARIAGAGVHGASSGHLAETERLTPSNARALLAALEREGSAIRAGDLWFSRSVVDDVRARITARLGSGGSVTVIDAKALCGLPRRQAIVLLEHFDAEGLTRREGDARVLAARGRP